MRVTWQSLEGNVQRKAYMAFHLFFSNAIDYFYVNIVIYGGFASKVDS